MQFAVDSVVYTMSLRARQVHNETLVTRLMPLWDDAEAAELEFGDWRANEQPQHESGLALSLQVLRDDLLVLVSGAHSALLGSECRRTLAVEADPTVSCGLCIR